MTKKKTFNRKSIKYLQNFIFQESVKLPQSKLKKQFDYADKKAIPFLSIVGGNEVAEGAINVKNLSTGEQKSFAKDDLDGILAFLA